MANTTKKKRFRFKKKFFAIVFLVVAVYCGTMFVCQQIELKKIEDEKKQIQAQIDAQKLKLQELNYLLEYSDTSDYIEKIAREKLGWVLQGETKYIPNSK